MQLKQAAAAAVSATSVAAAAERNDDSGCSNTLERLRTVWLDHQACN